MYVLDCRTDMDGYLVMDGLGLVFGGVLEGGDDVVDALGMLV